MRLEQQLPSILEALNSHGVIFYPTEAIYGLGCDPDSEQAVMALLEIKQRPVEKGLILIADNYAQVMKYIDDSRIPLDKRAEIFSSWPGATTWLLPANSSAPKWITGQHTSIAVRITDHPIVKQLCCAFNKPLVSTSANISGQTPISDISHARSIFAEQIAVYVEGALGGNRQASQIKDALSGKVIRE